MFDLNKFPTCDDRIELLETIVHDKEVNNKILEKENETLATLNKAHQQEIKNLKETISNLVVKLQRPSHSSTIVFHTPTRKVEMRVFTPASKEYKGREYPLYSNIGKENEVTTLLVVQEPKGVSKGTDKEWVDYLNKISNHFKDTLVMTIPAGAEFSILEIE